MFDIVVGLGTARITQSRRLLALHDGAIRGADKAGNYW